MGLALLLIGIATFRSLRSTSDRGARDPKSETAAKASRGQAVSNRPVSLPVQSRAGNRAAEILAELESGQDAPTGHTFKVGKGGVLASAPTWRVALLDELARLDPKAAAEQAEKILREFNSPDEWAISLRNYALAKTSPEAKAFLEERLRAMLQHAPWRENPSVGFLEAFDVAVYLGGTELMPTLTDLVRLTNNLAVAHAAYLALDRLTINDPVTTLAKLQAEPDLMRGREVTRANFFARADVADPRQRALIEAYLSNAQMNITELDTFTGLFPLASFHVEPGLLTPIVTPNHDTLARRDRAALAVIEEWMSDARFERLQPKLQTIKKRLGSFVTQGAGN